MIDPNEFAALNANAHSYYDQQQALSRAKQAAAATQGAGKRKGRGGTLTSLISEAGGTGGALAGGAIGTAIMPVVGTAIGAGLGGLLGGFGGRIAENEVRDSRVGLGDALTEGAMSGVMSLGPGNILKAGKVGLSKVAAKGAGTGLADALAGKAEQAAAAPLKNSMAGKVENFGNKQIFKDWGTMDAPTRRMAEPHKTIPVLADAGAAKPQDAERIARGFTGSDGLVNKAVLKAVGEATPVTTAGIDDILQESIINNSLSGMPQSKAVTDLVGAIKTKLGDVTEARHAFESAKRLEKQAADLEGAGGNHKRADPIRENMANVYRDVADHLKNAVYKDGGADSKIPQVVTPVLRTKLLALHPGNAQWEKYVNENVMNAKSVADLRHAQAPFVKASQMVDNAAEQKFAAAGQIAQNTQGIKSAILNKVTDMARQPLGQGARKVAKVLPGATEAGIKPAPTSLAEALKAPTKKGIARNLALGNAAEATLTPGTDIQAAANPDALQYGDGATAQIDPMTGMPLGASQSPVPLPTTPPTDPNNVFAPENIQANVAKLLSSGGTLDDVQTYLGLAKTMQAMTESAAPAEPKPLNATQQQQAFNAQTGLDSLQTIEQQIQANPNITKLASLPGGQFTAGLVGTGDYRAAIANATDVIGRLRSGGAISGDEYKAFRGMLPLAGDSHETALTKIRNVNSLLSKFANPQAAPAEPTGLAGALGY